MPQPSMKISKVAIAGLVIAAVSVLVIVISQLTHGNKERMSLSVNDHTLSLLVADDALERYRGLSGKTETALEPADGMVFVFSDQEERVFSMRGMKFDLDFVWILDGKVMGVAHGIKAPEKGEKPVTISSAPIRADMVLELPAGQARVNDLLPGTRVHFGQE